MSIIIKEDNRTLEIAKLVETLKTKKIKQKTKVELSDGFVVQISKRPTGSPFIKQPRYVYRGQVEFDYGPERKRVILPLLGGEFRSMISLVEHNIRYIIQRAKQHYLLETEDLQSNSILSKYI